MGPSDQITNDEFDASAFSWSHDGRYVAFWLKLPTSYTLTVLDTQTEKMVDYCFNRYLTMNQTTTSYNANMVVR